MQIPAEPFRITSIVTVAGVRRVETRNAANLAEAMDKFNKELAKAGKRTVRLDMAIAEAHRGGGQL